MDLLHWRSASRNRSHHFVSLVFSLTSKQLSLSLSVAPSTGRASVAFFCIVGRSPSPVGLQLVSILLVRTELLISSFSLPAPADREPSSPPPPDLPIVRRCADLRINRPSPPLASTPPTNQSIPVPDNPHSSFRALVVGSPPAGHARFSGEPPSVSSISIDALHVRLNLMNSWAWPNKMLPWAWSTKPHSNRCFHGPGPLRSRQMLRRRRDLRLLFVFLPMVFPPGLVPLLAMSREGSLAAAWLWASGSDPIGPISGCCSSNQVVDLVHIFQPLMEFCLHGPPCLVALHLTSARSKSITRLELNLWDIFSIYSPSKVMFSSPPWFFGFFPDVASGLKFLVGSSGSSLDRCILRLYLFSGKKALSPHYLPVARDSSSDLWQSMCSSFFIVLLSCGAVSTGPEDTSEVTLVTLVDGVWTPTSHYVTIPQLSDLVVKVPPTHSSIVLNPLSASSEDLSCLAYLYDVAFVYYQRGCIIPSCLCTEED